VLYKCFSTLHHITITEEIAERGKFWCIIALQ